MSDLDDAQHWDDPEWTSADIGGGRPPRGRRSVERTRTHHVVTARPVDEAYDDVTGDWSPVDTGSRPSPTGREPASTHGCCVWAPLPPQACW